MILDCERRINDDHTNNIAYAYYSAYFQRLEKLSGSDLEKVLNGIGRKQKRTMTDEEMLSVVKRMTEV